MIERLTCSTLLLMSLSIAQPGWAASQRVFPYGSICDSERQVCFQGRIDFDINRKIISIQGRLYRTAGEGTLSFHLTGLTPLDEAVVLPIQVEVRGNYSESISHQVGPPYSNRTRWSLERLSFSPD